MGQAEIPADVDEESEKVALENVLRLLKMHKGEASFVLRCARRWARHPLMEEIGKYAEVEFEDED